MNQAPDIYLSALRAAAIKHGMTLGVLDEQGNKTEAARVAAEDVSTRQGQYPGDGYTDDATSNVYTLDLNGNWVFAFNAQDLRRKMRTNCLSKLAEMFPPNWTPESTNAGAS